MFHNFKQGSLVRVKSLPWVGYADGKLAVGDLVTIHGVKPEYFYWNNHFVILKELLPTSPHHNIGTRHLQPTGLHVYESRNKREGKYAGHTSKIFKGHVKAKRGHSFVPAEHQYVCANQADCKR